MVRPSQQREERTKKRRRSYRAFWLVATVAVGVCGTRSARTVLALFPPSSLRLHRPIKAESGVLACILTPSPSSPPIFLVGTQGERRVNSITSTSGIFNPSPRRYAPQFSPIFCVTKHPVRLRGTAGRSLEVALYSFAMSRGSGLYFFYFNPLAPWALPLYSLTETPRNTTGHGRGERS